MIIFRLCLFAVCVLPKSENFVVRIKSELFVWLLLSVSSLCCDWNARPKQLINYLKVFHRPT